LESGDQNGFAQMWRKVTSVWARGGESVPCNGYLSQMKKGNKSNTTPFDKRKQVGGRSNLISEQAKQEKKRRLAESEHSQRLRTGRQGRKDGKNKQKKKIKFS